MYSDDDLIELLQQAEEEIVPLTSDAFDKHPEYPAKVTIKRRFGSWSQGCEKSNVESGQVTRKSILHSIQTLADSDEITNSEEFFQHPDTTSAATFYDKFDSWREAVDELSISIFDEYTNDDLINYVQQFYDEYRYVSQRKLKYDSSYPSSSTIVRRFGSWNKAVEAAGIEPNPTGVSPDESETGEKQRLFGSNWHTQREAALDRDNFKCRSCESETDLHVHHTKPRHTYRSIDVFEIEDANTLDNLVTLCETCHYDAHAGDVVPTNEQTTLKPRIV